MDWISCFPKPLQREWMDADFSKTTDIRLFSGGHCVVSGAGKELVSAYMADAEAVYDTAQALSRRMLRLSPATTGQGYITLQGGHRMGLCGTVTREAEGLLLHGIGSLCLRLARDVPGCGQTLACAARKGGGILLAGPPGSGKTTMLRDAVRLLSNGGIAVGLADERGEVAACLEGVPQRDVGERTHVADGAEKAEGLRWLLRAAAPQILATDELFGEDDCAAVLEAASCGVPVIATIHAGSMVQLRRRTGVMRLLKEGAVSQVMFLKAYHIIGSMDAGETLEAVCSFPS
ncbi:MAG: Flp pilus assembly complex ATPase component TadA [Clostridia bacterium]|nr:Flp pilus assembly complex ATPase component TadA [Clostridia bacterium]